MTTIYDAQYGHEAGGVVNTVIKAGQQLARHGVTTISAIACWMLTPSATIWRARPKAGTMLNQFGGTFGGPIRKDKDFLFASFEGWQEVIPFPGSGVTAVPLDMRDGQHFAKYNMVDLRSAHHAPLRSGHRTLQRQHGFHVLAQSIPRRCDSAKPHQPHRG